MAREVDQGIEPVRGLLKTTATEHDEEDAPGLWHKSVSVGRTGRRGSASPVELHCGQLLHHKVADVLPNVVFENGKVGCRQISDRSTETVYDVYVEWNERRLTAKHRHLRALCPENRQIQQKRQTSDEGTSRGHVSLLEAPADESNRV
jgi:hypothetical protein